MRYNYDTRPPRMFENVMRTPYAIEEPAGRYKLPNEIRARHHVHDTHPRAKINRAGVGAVAAACASMASRGTRFAPGPSWAGLLLPPLRRA